MEGLENCILVSVFSLMKAIYLDFELCFSKIDLLLQSVPQFFSTKWNNCLGGKIQISENSFEPCHKGPLRNKKSFVVNELNFSEMNSVMSRLGVACTVGDVENWGKGFCEEDLLKLFDEEEPSLEEIKETFGVFDANKDGFIDCGELQRVLCDLGVKEGCDLEDCERMIRYFDINGDGVIDFYEFVIFMEKCLVRG